VGREENVALTKTLRKGTAASRGRIFTGLLAASLFFDLAPSFFRRYSSPKAISMVCLSSNKHFYAD
jgi:hypothetical protein